MGLFNRNEKKETLDHGLSKTKESFFAKLSKSILGKSTVDDSVLDNLEETLITSDVGVETTLKIIDKLQERIKRDKYISTSELNSILRAEIATLLRKHDGTFPEDFDAPLPHQPYVVLVVGVNGVGKTTTIAKLAYQYKQAGKKVMLGAADTFRAAAVEQLQLWADRVGVPIVQQGMNADPASVAYDTLQSALSKGMDVVLIDTAGRLHNKVGLMNELGKIKKVMQKLMPDAPHEILLVLDASTGQNAPGSIAFFQAQARRTRAYSGCTGWRTDSLPADSADRADCPRWEPGLPPTGSSSGWSEAAPGCRDAGARRRAPARCPVPRSARRT